MYLVKKLFFAMALASICLFATACIEFDDCDDDCDCECYDDCRDCDCDCDCDPCN